MQSAPGMRPFCSFYVPKLMLVSYRGDLGRYGEIWGDMGRYMGDIGSFYVPKLMFVSVRVRVRVRARVRVRVGG